MLIDFGILHYYQHDGKEVALVPTNVFDKNNIWDSIHIASRSLIFRRDD